MNKKEILEFSERNYITTNQWIEFADKKATFILSAVLALFSVSLTLAPMLKKIIIDLILKTEAPLAFLGYLLIFFSVAYISLVSITLNHLVNIIYPKLKPQSKRKSLLFFQTIDRMEMKQFKNNVLKLKQNDLIDEFLDQTYNNSVIAVQKFKQIEKSISYLKWSFLLGLLLVLVGIIN